MEHAVTYSPTFIARSIEGNTQRLYARWLRFLEEEQQRLTGGLEP